MSASLGQDYPTSYRTTVSASQFVLYSTSYRTTMFVSQFVIYSNLYKTTVFATLCNIQHHTSCVSYSTEYKTARVSMSYSTAYKTVVSTAYSPSPPPQLPLCQFQCHTPIAGMLSSFGLFRFSLTYDSRPTNCRG